MKKLSIILLAAASIFAACNKVETAAPSEQKLVHKSFSAVSAETRTWTDNGLAVNWSDGDEINVIGITADKVATQHKFTLTSGAGTPNGTFEGEVGENEVTFYAVYPNVEVKPASFTATTPLFDFNASLGATQTAVMGGYDPNFAPMTAVADADGNLAFRHGAAFFKLTVGNEHVSSINLKTGNARFQGRPQYNLDGSYNNIQGAADNITLSGTIEKGATYYIPVLCKNSTVKTLTLTYNFNDGTPAKSLTTELFADVKLELGKVYDLHTPTIAIVPEIEAEDVLLEADATSGAIEFNVINAAADGVMTAALKEASDWLTVGAVSGSAVALTSTANTGDRRQAVVTLTYTYGDSKTSTLDVTVAQKAPGVAESHMYVFYVNSSGTTVQTKDGEAGSYFTTGGGNTSLGGDYSISTWTIGDYSSSKGWKMNSSGLVEFTTSSTLNTTVEFWFIRRKTGDSTAAIQIVPDGGTATVFNTPYDSIGDSGVLTLAKGTKHTIKQSAKEQALLLVVVSETE